MNFIKNVNYKYIFLQNKVKKILIDMTSYQNNEYPNLELNII